MAEVVNNLNANQIARDIHPDQQKKAYIFIMHLEQKKAPRELGAFFIKFKILCEANAKLRLFTTT
jgi:hypothetical protein